MYTGPHIITDGLVLALDAGNTKSYPGSGITWFDKSGRGNNGTLTNGPTFNSANGGSLMFDGVNDYTKITNTGILTPGTGNFTLDIWVNPVQFLYPFGPLMVTNITNGLWIGRSSNNFVIRAYGIADLLTYSVLPTNNSWNHIIATRLGTALSLYYNGIQVATATSAQNFAQSNLFICNDGDTGILTYTNAKVSSFKYYNKNLTAQEIQQNYNSTKTRYGL